MTILFIVVSLFFCVVSPVSAQENVLPEIRQTDFHVPEVTKVVSPSGITAWLIEEKKTPIIAVSLLFKGGIAADPERLRGLSQLTAALLDEGSASLDAEAFQKRLAEQGIRLSFDARADYFSVSMQTLRSHAADAFSLLKSTLTAPRFDRKAVRRVKEQIYASLAARKGDPSALVAERWNKLVFKGHPYAALTPSEKGISDITRANLRRYVRERFAQDNLIVGVSGNISAAELTDLLENTFSALPAHAVLKPVNPTAPQVSARVDVLSMDIPQSAVVFGHAGIARDDPDFYAALLVNHIFGSGSFNSRLFREIREKRGLTYGIATTLTPFAASPMLTGSAASDNAKMAQTVRIIQDEWAKISETGPTEKELSDAKKYITGSFPLTFVSGESMASFLAGMQYHHLGIDYLSRRNMLINSVTPEQAERVAQKLFSPDTLFFVVIGKPANL